MHGRLPMPLTDHDVLSQLRQLVQIDGSLRRATAALRVSPAYLCALLKGKREIGPKILKALYLRKVVVFEELPIPDTVPRHARRILEHIRRGTLR